MLAEILAAIFLVGGSAVALAAAVGVARLPDAFLRMHAATKAGMVGAGLVLVGAGFAFGAVEAWARVAAILLFLLVTLPLASHALGRAAYVGGAPLWSGTMTDQLEGVLARGVFDIDPARRARRPAAASEGGTPGDAPVLAFRHGGGGEAPAAAFARPAAAPRRILVALAGGEEAAPALLHGLRALAPGAGEATLLSLVCVPTVEATGPVPLGGAHWARRLAAHRLAAARASAAALADALEGECRRLGLPCRTRHEEGDAALLLRAAAARHDLVLLPRDAWFDHGHALPSPAPAARRRAAALAAGPTLLAGADGTALASPRRVLFLEDGRAASGAALARFLALGLAPGAPVLVLALDLPGAAGAAEEARALAAAHGRAAEVHPTPLHPDHPPGGDAWAGPGDLLVAAHDRAAEPRGAAAALRLSAGAVLLA